MTMAPAPRLLALVLLALATTAPVAALATESRRGVR